MARQITQCLSCHRIKKLDNSWKLEELSPFQKDISHTYCSDCLQSLQEKLFAARDFNKWGFDKQRQYLSQELDRQPKMHDRLSLKNYLEEFFCINEDKFEKYYEALKN